MSSIYTLPWYSPRILHGIQLKDWLKLLREAKYQIDRSRIPYAMALSLISIANSALAHTTKILHKEQKQVDLSNLRPIFIIGHWRTGSTLLHHLLSLNSSLHSLSAYKCFAINHWQLTSGSLSSLLNKLTPGKRPTDNFSFSLKGPQEEEFAFSNLGLKSLYSNFVSPSLNYRLDDITTEELATAYSKLLDNSSGQPLFKNPTTTARLKKTLSIFPRARFIHLSRKPDNMLASTINLYRALNRDNGLSFWKEENLEDLVIQNCKAMYKNYFEDIQLLNSKQLLSISFEDLTKNPYELVLKVFDWADLKLLNRDEQGIFAATSNLHVYRPTSYSLQTKFIERINIELKDYMDFFGYK